MVGREMCKELFTVLLISEKGTCFEVGPFRGTAAVLLCSVGQSTQK